MGEVFVAQKSGAGGADKKVAIKLLLPHLTENDAFVRMFLDEARIAASMNHPNIVKIYDVGEADGRYFIAMSLVEGASVAGLLRECRKQDVSLPLPVIRALAVGLCDALDYAHGLRGPEGTPLRVIHRDVAPSNVLVSRAGEVVLTDFGIAKANGNLHHTRTGDVKGKYAYMAPEQMRSDVVIDHRVDVYAASVTLYEALTGVSPFLRASDPETIDAVRTLILPSALGLRSDVSRAFADALARGASKDPAERFDRARALRDALLDGPVASPEEVGEWVTRLTGASAAAVEGEPAPATLSLPRVLLPAGLGHDARALEARFRMKPSRRLWVAAAALLAVGIGVGFAARSSTGAPSVPPAPVAKAEAPPAPPVDPVATAADVGTLASRGTAPVPRAAAAASSTAPRLATRYGFLTVDAVPWATVYVNGRKVERTPISRLSLPVGTHRLTFYNSDLGKKTSRRVTIREGREQTLQVDLRR
jgi:serine/threonine-protein kinase